MDGIGTLAWTRRTQGHLRGRERLAFTVDGVRSQLRDLSAMTAHRLGIRREPLARVDLDAVKLPDTKAAREAEEVCASLPASIEHHSHRAYLWAIALAEVDRTTYDAEFLYCACLLHDAGVPPALEKRSSACFTLESASLAQGAAERGGWPAERAERLAEAMTLHVNAHLPPEQGVEAHLLASGALVDGIGRRHWQVDPAYVQAVLARHPRLAVKTEMNDLLREHARLAPKGRIAFYYRYGALGQLIKRAPYAS